jgi:putative ABC transport system substrate-binding protein
MNRRRCFFATLLLPGLARAQDAGKRFRIGWLSSSPYPGTPLWDAFLAAMRERGWSEGAQFTVEHRRYAGHAERLPALAAELVAAPVDAIVAAGTPPALAAKAATKTIPIVFFYVGDPVGSGLVASLARPGGNATGLGGLGPELYAKQLELLSEAVPKARRIAVLVNAQFPAHVAALPGLEQAARQLRLALDRIELRAPEDIDAAFATLARSGAEALLVLAQPFLFRHGERIARLVAAQGLPAMAGPEEFADAGLLMTYGDRLVDAVRRVPYYLDRILREGKRPDELPVEQATRFYLTVNAKTARALRLVLPSSLLLRAERTIE